VTRTGGTGQRRDAAIETPQTPGFRLKAFSVAFMLIALLAACGGGGSGSGGQPAGSIKVTLTEFKFDPSTITVPHGKVVLYLVNAGAVSHDLIIRDSANNRVGGSELISAGDTFVFTIDNLSVGSYTFICDQPGHESSGMKGTLTASP
jgi:plastocyanin